MICPLVDACAARRLGIQEVLPRRSEKAERPTRYGTAFVLQRADGAILLRRREEKGLLGGMMEVPSSEWSTLMRSSTDLMAAAPVEAGWTELPGMVRHTFTHFHLELRVVAAIAPSRAKTKGDFVPLDALGAQALPSVMRKVIDHAVMHLAQQPSRRSA